MAGKNTADTGSGSHPSRRSRTAWAVIALGLIAFAAPAPARADSPGLTDLDLEDLMNVEVQSVSRKLERLFDAPAAIYVLNREDLRRSGATSIAEALRMVPGLHVAATDANRWAIAPRGPNTRFANRLLVLVDGRSVYTPLFSGVYWDVQDTLLDDVERIEVIRGPGGTMWGTNAVDGVINIITRNAAETPGIQATAGFGSHEKSFGSVQWGGEPAPDLHLRVFGKYFDRSSFVTSDNDRADDGWDVFRGGFRMDWERSEHDSLTLDGAAYTGDVGRRVAVAALPPAPSSTTVSDDDDLSGGHLLARWERRSSDTAATSLQVYVDHTKRNEIGLDHALDTLDLDLQQRGSPGDRHDVVWGLGYRSIRSRTRGSFSSEMVPKNRHDDILSAFLQDEIALVREKLFLTLGVKLERNHYTHLEVQPGSQLLWRPREGHAAWLSVARAVRTPAIVDSDLVFHLTVTNPPAVPMTTVVGWLGDKSVESENLLAWEIGYRVRPEEDLFLDLTGFLHLYDHLRTAEVQAPTVDPTLPGSPLTVMAKMDGLMDGATYGLEAAARWNVSSRWRLAGAYSFLRVHYAARERSTASSPTAVEQNVPVHQLNLRSFYDLTDALELDTLLYVVGAVSNQDTPSYTRLDLRLGWKLRPDLELSVALQNLLEHRHKEWGNGDDGVLAAQVPRSAYARLTWRH